MKRSFFVSVSNSALRLLFGVLRYGGILLLLLFGNVSSSDAQSAYFWSAQEKIPQYWKSTEEPPYLIADQNRTIHSFNSQPIDLTVEESTKAVYYRQWTLENGWTTPNDILVDSNGGDTELIAVAFDDLGRVHLIVQRGDNLYYTQAYLADAYNASSWLPPILIARSSEHSRIGFVNVGAIATNTDGSEIVVIFSGNQVGNGLYFTTSFDNGNTWTEPYPVYLTSDDSVVVADPKLYSGNSGLIHAVWGTSLESGFGDVGFYANFNDDSRIWSEPYELGLRSIGTPSVIETNGEVFVSYYYGNLNGNWWQHSTDDGKSWSPPAQFSPQHKGTNGAISFVTDSRNILHAFFGERIDDQNHGMWHSLWTGVSWTNPDAVVRGPQVRDIIGGNGFDPRSARAVISNGNVILVTWATDGAAGINGAWYSYKQLDTPEFPAIPLPNPPGLSQSIQPPVNSTVVSPIVETIPSAPTHDPGLFAESSRFVENPQAPIFCGIISGALFLVGVVIANNYFRNREK